MDTVRITCEADDFLPFQQIQDFQGQLKSRTLQDIDHLITSIETHGFSFPFFVWRQPDGTCSCLDGHGRILALKQLEKEGCAIPDLPVVYIEADSEAEARTKLIHINTTSGKFTDSGFRDLVKDIPDIDVTSYHYPELDLEKINIELKVLAQAEDSIQNVMGTNWNEVFSSDASEFNTDGLIPDPSSAPLNQAVPAPGPMAGSVAAPAGPMQIMSSELPESPDVADDQEPESEMKELVVYCQECGKSFIYQYKK